MLHDSSSKFPGSGSLPKRLRRLLYPELMDHEGETISVCLMAHLLVENSLNELLYRWLKRDTSMIGNPKKKKDKEKADEELWKHIVELGFAKKYELVKPFLSLYSPKAAKNTWEINTLRNDIFHGRAIKDAKFQKKPISDEKTVEGIFLAAQGACRDFRKLEELLEASHSPDKQSF